MPPQKKNNYIDNEKLYNEIKSYIEKLQTSPKARIPESIGHQIWQISNGLSYSPSFIRYGFREDLVQAGVVDCLKYIRNYDITKSNPHAYFTTICFRAFIRHIQKEKKNLYTKFKVQIESNNEMNFDIGASAGDDIQTGMAGDFARMSKFVEDYENSSAFVKK